MILQIIGILPLAIHTLRDNKLCKVWQRAFLQLHIHYKLHTTYTHRNLFIFRIRMYEALMIRAIACAARILFTRYEKKKIFIFVISRWLRNKSLSLSFTIYYEYIYFCSIYNDVFSPSGNALSLHCEDQSWIYCILFEVSVCLDSPWFGL